MDQILEKLTYGVFGNSFSHYKNEKYILYFLSFIYSLHVCLKLRKEPIKSEWCLICSHC